MNAGDRHNGFRDGIRYAVSWLHDRAREMNDPWAKAVLNVTANDLGRLGVERTQQAKANLLEICLTRAAQQNAPEHKVGDYVADYSELTPVKHELTMRTR